MASKLVFRAPLGGIALISCGALGYEILLTHLLSILHWHHFAAMVISLALLGYGASGVFLTLGRERLARNPAWAMASNALLFALGALLTLPLAQRIPLNPLELPWTPRQLYYLPALYLLLAVPFFGAANCIGLALGQFQGRGHRIYASDLLGAGSGALLLVGLLYLMPAEQALAVVSLLGWLAAWSMLRGQGRSRGINLALVGGLALILGCATPGSIRLEPAPYKDLPKSLAVLGSNTEYETSGPQGRISLLRNDQVPFRQAPGMSFASLEQPPRQLALFINGNDAGVVNRFDGVNPPGFVDQLTSALPYHLLSQPRVLILGAGGGTSLLQALRLGARQIDSLENNPQLVELLRGRLREFSGGLFHHPALRMHLGEARSFLAANPARRFDLILLNPAEGYSSATSGLGAQNESFLYSLEAIVAYLEHLEPDGVLAFNLWLHLPPRDSLKLAATLTEALRGRGLTDPARHLALIRGWRTIALLVKPAGLTAADVAAVRVFCRQRSFDPVFFPGVSPEETNRYNRLDDSPFFSGVSALLGPAAEGFIAGYPFDIRPVSDDRPYFFSFSRWRSLPELLRLPASGGVAQLDWGYWLLVLGLAQALLAVLLLILLPLYLLKRRQPAVPSVLFRRTLGYFGLLGLAFMFMEIAFIQRFTLLLAQPILAISTALAGFLIFAGLGSYWSQSLFGQQRHAPLGLALAISLAGGLYLLLLPRLFEPLQLLAMVPRVGLTLLLIAPLALVMGMPFPLGIARLGQQAPGLIPVAWGVNGSASVVGATLAAVLVVDVGFSGLVLASGALYLLAALHAP